MTITTSREKHKDYILFPVIVIVYCQSHKEFTLEFGLIKYTFTIKIK
jgi:hypothetical protein